MSSPSACPPAGGCATAGDRQKNASGALVVLDGDGASPFGPEFGGRADAPRYNLSVTERPPRAPRAEPREVVELKQLKATQPELASAVDMQLALVEMQRRVQSRVPLPWIQAEPEWLRAQQIGGRPLVRFGDIPLDWSDFRLTFRQTADILRRFDALEPAEHETILALARDGDTLQP